MVSQATVDNRESRQRVPGWVWALIIALSAVEPITHFWIAYAPPEGYAPTGLHSLDSAYYLDCMNMFPSAFATPYATCQSPYGENYIGFFSTTIYWMYGIVGLFGNLLNIPPFLFLGIANGAGAFLYFLAVYRFLAAAFPKNANAAFVIFTLGGGPAGILYVAAMIFGLDQAPAFGDYILRFAMYELIEGSSFLPVLHTTRLYYTVPLALCLSSLTAFIADGKTRPLYAALLLFAGSLINFRYGAFVLALAAIWAWERDPEKRSRRLRRMEFLVGAWVLATALSILVIRTHPTFSANTFETHRTAVWLSPLITAALLHLFLVPRQIALATRGMGVAARAIVFGFAGYLGLFLVLFLAYQTYHGNLLVARDAAVAIWVSDKALAGAALGVAFSFYRRPTSPGQSEYGWVALWLLLFLALSISAFGGGWFLNLNPQRLIILVTLPASILSAAAIGSMAGTNPRRARACMAAFVGLGLCSITVGALFFQGPLTQITARGPHGHVHTQTMTRADEKVLSSLETGTVIAPRPFGDILSTRPGIHTLYGVASVHADQEVRLLEPLVAEFFSPDPPHGMREAALKEWCVDYVFCPDTWPLSESIVESLGREPSLLLIAEEGRAKLFRVRNFGP